MDGLLHARNTKKSTKKIYSRHATYKLSPIVIAVTTTTTTTTAAAAAAIKNVEKQKG